VSRSTVVVKIGSSSLTTPQGDIDVAVIAKLCAQIAQVRSAGERVVVVTSGAVAVGLPMIGFPLQARPRDGVALRAASAVGQSSLMRIWEQALGRHGLVAGQVLLAPTDFMLRRRYLTARGTMARLLDLGVVPVVNENDAVADDEIRFPGDNDRLAALVTHLVDARLLVLLTDAAGFFTSDPRRDSSASLIEEIVEIDHELEALAGGAGSSVGRGGMASKLAAAKMGTWSGVETVIAAAGRDGVLVDAVAGRPGVGSVFRARDGRLGARKSWIAFAVPAAGRVTVDAGARRALEQGRRSLLPAGVTGCDGTFGPDEAVEIADEGGSVFAKGLVRWSAAELARHAGRRTDELPEHLPHEVVHRDDLVALP
jgi:glutamate 5-kinase